MPKYVNEFFYLNAEYTSKLYRLKPNFGYDGFGEIVFYRTYSRIKSDGSQESWHDVVLRVINGTMSIRKDWYCKNFVNWNEEYWQKYAYEMSAAMFKMYWLPAGRGLWQMGTSFVFDRGGMSLNNCGYTILGSNETLANDLHWMMDALMLGVGVGFEPVRDNLIKYTPVGKYTHYVQDSREGWADSVRLLVDAFTKPNYRQPIFSYAEVRGKGSPIRGFGGLSSGPEPLESLHNDIVRLFSSKDIDVVRLKTDLANKLGVCVVAGNVRRSAELSKGRVDDPIFLELKNYETNPDREDWGWMSNNTVALKTSEDFEMLGEVAKRVVIRGEPGVMNLKNFVKGRVGKYDPHIREDKATGLNPCGEIPLEDKELCNVVETVPTRCPNVETWYKACEYAAFYATTVSLLPTHREETNRVVVRNRRIGVGIIDWTGWVKETSLHKVTAYMRKGYETVVRVATERSAEAGVCTPVRFTTIKPGGTGPKLPGKTSGIGYPTFVHTLRRMRVASNNPICAVLDDASIPFEPDFYDPAGTRVYEYPTKQGPARPASEVSLWQQAMNLVTVQREWSDNAVSNTLYFKPKWKLVCYHDTVLPVGTNDDREKERILKRDFPRLIAKHVGRPEMAMSLIEDFKTKPIDYEYHNQYKTQCKENRYGEWELYIYLFDPTHEEDIIEEVLSSITPLIKSCSLLPHSAKGAYRQMPEEGISAEEYESRLRAIKKIDWSLFRDSDGLDEKYCQGDACLMPLPGDNCVVNTHGVAARS